MKEQNWIEEISMARKRTAKLKNNDDEDLE
jgi:hypothetical protein